MTEHAHGAPPQSFALAEQLAERLVRRHGVGAATRTVIGIAGESGSGKSVTAANLARALEARGIATGFLNQDDYFHLPPRSNHLHRVEDVAARIGPQEVNLDLLAMHVADFRAARDRVAAPRVDWHANEFLTREIDFSPLAALVVEGTYVLNLRDLDVRIFLEATHEDTRERRRLRGRDIVDPVIDEILALEHRIIARQADRADVVIDREFVIRESTERGP